MSGYRGVSLAYQCELALLSPELRHAFVALDADDDTRIWMDACFARPHGALASTARAVARKVMSDYDANALVDMHDMRVLGTSQWRQLLSQTTGGLLDVGAGDGRVTELLAPLAGSVTVTETSTQMAKRLRKRGWQCHEIDLATDDLPGELRFDLIALLNVIDRTAMPITLLERLRPLLASEGRLIVAVPFPLRPHVHVGPQTVDPEEVLPITRGWETQANVLTELLFAPCGYQVERLARAPYLCRGDRSKPVITLDDAIFVLRGQRVSLA